MDLIVYHIWFLELPHRSVSYLALPHMDLIMYHIWPRTTTYSMVYHICLELPHMDLIVYHIWHRTTLYGLDSVSH